MQQRQPAARARGARAAALNLKFKKVPPEFECGPITFDAVRQQWQRSSKPAAAAASEQQSKQFMHVAAAGSFMTAVAAADLSCSHDGTNRHA
jgi:hypothetical protein